MRLDTRLLGGRGAQPNVGEAGSRGLVQLRSPGQCLVCRMASPNSSTSWQACAWASALGWSPPQGLPRLHLRPGPALVPFPQPHTLHLHSRAAELSAQVAKTKVRKGQRTLLECSTGRPRAHTSPAQPRASNSQYGTSAVWEKKTGGNVLEKNEFLCTCHVL